MWILSVILVVLLVGDAFGQYYNPYFGTYGAPTVAVPQPLCITTSTAAYCKGNKSKSLNIGAALVSYIYATEVVSTPHIANVTFFKPSIRILHVSRIFLRIQRSIQCRACT